MSIVAAELIAKVTADTSSAERDLKTFGQRVGSMTGSVFSGNMLDRAVAGVGRGLVNVAGAGVAAFGDMLSSGMDFSAQMDAVTAVLGGTNAEAKALSDLAIDLAVSPTLKVNATEAAAAIQNLATAGLTAEQILGGATEATVLLANSTGGDFGQAATVATDVMSLFNIEAENMMGAVDGIAAVSNVSKFDLNDYALAIAQAGGVAAMSGVEFDDFNAVIAATSPAFASGSDAGTSFKTFLQRLNPTTVEARDLMAELNLLTEDGTSVFYDATGQLRDMDEVIGIMNSTFGEMNEQQQSFYLGQLFGTDAMRTAGQLVATTTEEYAALKEVMGDTSAIDMAAIATDNFKSKWENFTGALDATKLDIFTQLEPALMGIMDSIMPALEGLTPIVTAWAEDAGQAISDGLAAVRATANVVWDISEGDMMTTIMASIGRLTGATMTIDAEAKVTDVDWGWFKYTYDALGEVRHWEFFDLGYTYDAKGDVTTWTFQEDTSFTYKAEGEISEWNFGKLTYTYSADGSIDTLEWDGQVITSQGDAFSIAAEATVSIISDPASAGLAANQFMKDLDAQLRTMNLGQDFDVTVSAQMAWGVIWTTVYPALSYIYNFDWKDIWTKIYEADAAIKEFDWEDVWTKIYELDAAIDAFDWKDTWVQKTIDVIANIDWGGVWESAKTLTVNLIPNWFGGGDTPPPPPPVRRNPNAPNYNPLFDNNATGNPMYRGGLTWVGERGPELVALPRASRIWSADESAGMMGGSMVINNYNTVTKPHDIELIAQRVAAHMAKRSR